MKIKPIIIAALIVGVASVCLPSEMMGVENTTKFSSTEITQHANDLSTFLFGPVAKVAGVLGGAYGLISAILSSNIRPLITFGGIGLGVALVPKFINSVFTLLLP